MAYHSDKIAAVLSRLNGQYFLPAIQREFVWSPGQIVELWDSLLRGYPIGSFLFWQLKPENREKWQVYKFVEHFKQGGSHNIPANTAGVQQLTLVLDGQQRLTALLIGLRGSYTVKRKYRRWDDPDAWVKQHLYLDLLQDPKLAEEDGETGVRYGFQFLDPQVAKAGFIQPIPGREPAHYWLKVGRILDFDSEEDLLDFRQTEKSKLPNSVTLGQLNTFELNLQRLHRAVWQSDAISHYTELDQDYDRVLDIFVRANEGGTKLSKSDLLLSMVTNKWAGVNARDEIYSFVDRLNNELVRKNYFDKDFVMKTCLVLSDLPVQYKVENFNNHNLSVIQNSWKSIKTSLESCVTLVNTYGVDRDTLTSANALIPIAYYLCQNAGRSFANGSTAFEIQNASRMRRWLLAALLNNVFGGQSDNMLREMRRVLQEHAGPSRDFPISALNDQAASSGKSAVFDEYALEEFLNIGYGRQVTFLALSLLYDDMSWGVKPHHVDHVFPRALFSSKSMNAAGLDGPAQSHYWSLMNRIGNLELLLAEENQEKSGQPFELWVTTRADSFKSRHLIPDDPDLLRFERFADFISAREKLIRARLTKLFA